MTRMSVVSGDNAGGFAPGRTNTESHNKGRRKPIRDESINFAMLASLAWPTVLEYSYPSHRTQDMALDSRIRGSGV